ncbi:MAG: Gfo/Idh/MocA family oxidoreductase [Gemmatimonadetes bacterium]|nr:Gfo/Idh/MocA family oxidoreductase [Gemmatimonadota bacterium]MYA43480.1 Gfo/Idh/MocA family oxidoreductase [Gemmatimonadota bacterium]MYE94683.1 Gfo/Idh/MocA family oxidoreductase [Gemmatimonadota bacterium]MYJ09827.1 Gfo/Idh/MocA family oxidoreductase [Gemmatimonadota bacterium]
MVGGGPGAFIGAVHRMAAALDGEYELVAGAFASRPGRSREQGRLLGLDARRTYNSFQDMAQGEAALGEDRRIDAVSVVTPNHLHHPVARTFLRAGFHVICDKPMTTTLADAEDLCRTVEATGLTFALTHNYTGYPMVREARHLVRAGRLGTVRKVVAEYPQGWLGTRLEQTGHKQASWRQDPARAGASSAVADIGSHVHSLVGYVTGLEIGEVFAELSSLVPGRVMEDDATMLVRFVGGARGVYSASQVSTGEENGLALRVYGEDAGLLWRQERPNEVRLLPAEGPRETLTRGSPGLSPAARHATRLPPGHPEGFIEAFANLYRGVGRVIGAAIAGCEADPLDHDFPNHRDGARGMHFIESVLESAAAGRWVNMAGYRP